MKHIVRAVSFFGMLSLSQIAISDSITDTYNTGDTLSASTLNTIKNAVNDNNSRIGSLEGTMSIKAVDANNLVIGELVSINANYNMEFDVFTTQGYLEVGIPMSPRISSDARLYYLTTNCTGTPYSDYPNGTVFLARQPNTVYAKYYTPKDSVAQIITVQSFTYHDPGPCFNLVTQNWLISENWYFPANQNVPAITGVEDIMYTLPITFQRQ